MEGIQTLRSQVIAVPIKERVQEKITGIKGFLKQAGILKSSEAGYGQMGEAVEPMVNADGTPITKQQKTYQDDTCKGRCLYYACCRCSKRYYIAWLSSLGFMITFGIRCNMAWAMLSMQARHKNMTHQAHMLHLTPPTSTHMPDHVSTHLGVHGGTGGHSEHGHTIGLAGIMNVTTKPDFYWTAGERGLVDSSFFYGYLVTQIPGGVIAAKFPANKLFGIAVGGSALLNLLLPSACRAHYGLVMAIRVMQGLVEGTSYPACHGIWRYWAPPLERSRLATIAFCGSYAGAVLGLSLSGVLAETMGWQAPFYTYGIVGLLWFIWWWRVTHERPSLHPTITEAERNYIETSLGESPNIVESKIPIPWGKFFTSLPVYAIIVANFARSWSFYLLITKSPKYFREVFGYNLAETGFLAALPHLVMAIIVPLGGQLADRLRKHTLSTTVVRKLFNCGGFGMEAVFLLGVGYSKQITSALVCLVLAVGFSGFAISGYNVNHLDIAPRYASILMGLSNGVGTISGMICPLTTELLTKGERKEGWATVFLIASLVHFCGVIFYGIFASGEKQPWASAPEEATSNWQPPTDLPPEMTHTDYGYFDGENRPQPSGMQRGSMGTGQQAFDRSGSVKSGGYGYNLDEQSQGQGTTVNRLHGSSYAYNQGSNTTGTNDPYHQGY